MGMYTLLVLAFSSYTNSKLMCCSELLYRFWCTISAVNWVHFQSSIITLNPPTLLWFTSVPNFSTSVCYFFILLGSDFGTIHGSILLTNPSSMLMTYIFWCHIISLGQSACQFYYPAPLILKWKTLEEIGHSNQAKIHRLGYHDNFSPPELRHLQTTKRSPELSAPQDFRALKWENWEPLHISQVHPDKQPFIALLTIPDNNIHKSYYH
jgi:hypothetical protein